MRVYRERGREREREREIYIYIYICDLRVGVRGFPKLGSLEGFL